MGHYLHHKSVIRPFEDNLSKGWHYYSPAAYNTYSVRNYNGEDLFVHALQDTVPEITTEIKLSLIHI